MDGKGLFLVVGIVAFCATFSLAAPLPGDAVWHWQASEPVLPLPGQVGGKALSVLVRLASGDLPASGEVLALQGKGGRAALRFSWGEHGGQPVLLAEMATDARDRPLLLAVPRAGLERGSARVVVLRYTGPRLEIWADGVLIDEDWPLGSLLPAEGPVKVATCVEQAAVWNRALSDDELQQLSGGREGLAEREIHWLGPERPVGQLWKPRGFNANVGDCMPFFHDGQFHLFYLFDRRHHQSKWGLGAHQWANATTTDLVHWEDHGLAVPITDEHEGSICTGSTFFHDGTYYAFYAVRMADGSPAELCGATSPDGIHFTKNPPLARLTAPYNGSSARDPVVFRDEATGLFHMLVTTSLVDPPIAGRGGCLGHLVSHDLKTWEQREPFIVPGYPGEPECADAFAWHGWYYLLFSNQGVARYRMARSPLGPWVRPKSDALEGPQAIVMKTAGFTGDRRIGAAFLPDGGYGGYVVFREIVQHADGTLGTRWPAEMMPAAGPACALKCEPLTTGASGDATSVTLDAPQGLEAASLGDVPRDFLFRCRVKPQPGAAQFGLRFRAGEKMRGGTELRFEPQREKLGVRPADMSSWDEAEDVSLYAVEGLDREFTLELIVRGDILDVCVDGRRTLVARARWSDGDRFCLFAQNAEVTLDAISIQPVSP